MSRYSERIDEIYDHVSNIRVSVASINSHLETLNGKVVNHRNRIESLEKDNIKNKIKWARIGGVSATIGAIIGALMSIVLRGVF